MVTTTKGTPGITLALERSVAVLNSRPPSPFRMREKGKVGRWSSDKPDPEKEEEKKDLEFRKAGAPLHLVEASAFDSSLKPLEVDVEFPSPENKKAFQIIQKEDKTANLIYFISDANIGDFCNNVNGVQNALQKAREGDRKVKLTLILGNLQLDHRGQQSSQKASEGMSMLESLLFSAFVMKESNQDPSKPHELPEKLHSMFRDFFEEDTPVGPDVRAEKARRVASSADSGGAFMQLKENSEAKKKDGGNTPAVEGEADNTPTDPVDKDAGAEAVTPKATETPAPAGSSTEAPCPPLTGLEAAQKAVEDAPDDAAKQTALGALKTLYSTWFDGLPEDVKSLKASEKTEIDGMVASAFLELHHQEQSPTAPTEEDKQKAEEERKKKAQLKTTENVVKKWKDLAKDLLANEKCKSPFRPLFEEVFRPGRIQMLKDRPAEEREKLYALMPAHVKQAAAESLVQYFFWFLKYRRTKEGSKVSTQMSLIKEAVFTFFQSNPEDPTHALPFDLNDCTLDTFPSCMGLPEALGKSPQLQRFTTKIRNLCKQAADPGAIFFDSLKEQCLFGLSREDASVVNKGLAHMFEKELEISTPKQGERGVRGPDSDPEA
uniref:Uncharacterized protein n=1 Tax=Chromera velia CCMP2878 TaxID=1169474 RepID=A0A0G4FPY8_9ALVE|eukprot:Cvel_18184.t1-p1 / transcript=Cvel_18184.t1 / gene=Cvel_18184 / organism=Chromera_velia_CCMP2878 / gene_product=hypothetical protein / transcript_product=hypothetical protein / location=Cvel_scaffold1491:36758-44768(-) / protein_length=604 / sequence_SO=supercontig / SO=protein_coding / is_pseudo=false